MSHRQPNKRIDTVSDVVTVELRLSKGLAAASSSVKRTAQMIAGSRPTLAYSWR